MYQQLMYQLTIYGFIYARFKLFTTEHNGQQFPRRLLDHDHRLVAFSARRNECLKNVIEPKLDKPQTPTISSSTLSMLIKSVLRFVS